MPKKIATLAAVLFAFCLRHAAFAEPCSDGPEPIVPIRVSANGCFEYKGNAIYFSGTFSRGQTAEVHMSGEAAEQDYKGKITTYTDNRNANVEGPDDFNAESTSNDGSLTFRVPRNGVYKFSYGPHSMLCANGQVKICIK